MRKRGNIQTDNGCEDVHWIQLARDVMEYGVFILAMCTLRASTLRSFVS
jgi:hypothetical protein